MTPNVVTKLSDAGEGPRSSLTPIHLGAEGLPWVKKCQFETNRLGRITLAADPLAAASGRAAACHSDAAASNGHAIVGQGLRGARVRG
jgi:hypothetical protein